MGHRKRTISPERQGLFHFGTALLVVGVLVILVGFIGFIVAGRDAVASHGAAQATMVDGKVEFVRRDPSDPIAWWIAFAIGMVLTAVGSGLRTLAARGVAGSGLVLDPERARADLEPWSRMGGGMLKDAIDASGLPLGQEPPGTTAPPLVKVRCPKCRALCDETAKFCSACAAPL